MVPFLRALAALGLGMVVITGLVLVLVVFHFTQRLEDPGVYNAAVSDTGAYGRIHNEVLVDEALKERTARLLGDTGIAFHDEAIDVLREVIPPAYLQGQTQANIKRLTRYLRHDEDELEIYLVLKEPLERVEPAMLGKVHELVDELEISDPPSSGCGGTAVRRLATSSAEPYSQLSQGGLPQSAPSLKILSRECREREFDHWFGLVLEDPSISAPTARILEGRREELRRIFIDGDTREFLKAAADPLVQPLVEEAVADIRRDLQPGDKLDLLEWLASQPGGPVRADIDARTAFLKEALGTANGLGNTIALAMVVLGSLLSALVHLPRPAAMLRWPGITLLVGGVVCLVAGFVVHSVVPGLVRERVMGPVSFSAEVPVPAVDLAGDLLESLVRQATTGFMPATAIVIAAGLLLIAASLFYGKLLALVGRNPPTQEHSGHDWV